MQIENTQQLRRSLAWLKNAAGIDDDYIKRWSPAEWEAWQSAMLADAHGDNPAVPDWMNPIIRGKWHNDFTLPFPQVGQLLPSAHPWFMEALQRPDFSLSVTEPIDYEFPQLSQIEAVYNEAMLRAWTPLLSLMLQPTRTPGVIDGAVEALYIVAPTAASEDVAELMRSHDLPDISTRLKGPSRSGRDLLAWVGLPMPEGDIVAWGSEWIY
ncbi:hypothetical protein [Leucobacter chromiireducens]|uniref:Uncharacterized protein n=1 Tax=Leucobacter chromiireducens subsp. solipictus TaxID=398235 RepID=A0ABS1SF80_9MICO|nr:hypothetical protein [Leucobacter chromiireducens]MBL3678541.1 hypothetical protein [Leucobacter chromiireducens subsp. solipictus]